ncbi:MAG: enoyl-CoA hydratase/isomerase family protein [Phycisphaerae bacterium]|nr:enoyl-CoA hydratase/isomerase family protein [Phycisphaerae bacterium]
MAHEKSQTDVRLSKEGEVATVQFIPGAGVNIFSSRVIGNLGTVVEKIAADPRIRFVVFRGDGKVFLAGADISEMQSFNEDHGRAFATNGHNVFNAIEALPQITFAALNGHALGGGCELAMSCDFRLIVSKAKIGQPETRLGLIPGWGGTQRLTRYVGLGQARRLLFSGDSISAEEALRLGLVDEVVPSAEELDAALHKWFKMLTPGSPAAITCVKRAMLRKDEIAEFGKCFSCSDVREGAAAFLEKRTPSWATWKSGEK